jgi:hypothetical protein
MSSVKQKVFYSFHYDKDVFRVQQIRNIGAIEENKPVTVNAWEEVKKGGNKGIEKWINDNMKDKTCVVILVGEDTSNRPWVRYEIKKAWADGKGLLGIYIHNLKCPVTSKKYPYTGKSVKGKNPFDTFTLGDKDLSDIVYCYDPDHDSPNKDIINNLEKWIEKAITIRNKYAK